MSVDHLFQWIFHATIVVPTTEHYLFTKVQSLDDVDILRPGGGIEIKVNHVLAVDHQGIIVLVEAADRFFDKYPREQGLEQHSGFTVLSTNEFLCPGMIDLHIHAPQYAFAGTATDRPLLGDKGWLETYTFPTEQSLRNLQLARHIYHRVVTKTLRLGTTMAVYFATLDLEPTKILVDVALSAGQRALVGKVCMDRNSPPSYCDSVENNLTDTQLLIDYIHEHPRQQREASVMPLVAPVVTPRFIPTCSPALLEGLAKIATENDCHITSHISESIDEVEFSRQLDKIDHGTCGRTDAEIFHSHGLLTNKCIMAHGVHLNEKDLELLHCQGSAVAHCPLSNCFFAGGALPCRKLMERGNKVGLGTDIAGGYSPSMLNSCRHAVTTSLTLQHQYPNEQHCLDYLHAFYLATLAGAEALGMEKVVGSLCAGMEFDAFVFSVDAQNGPDIFERDTIVDVFQKLCLLGDDRNVTRVFVQGREVKVASA